MILDKIKTYLNGRSDITYEIDKPVLDTCNIESIIDKYHIAIIAPVKNDMQLHRYTELNLFAESFYNDLKKHPDFENYVFEEAKNNGVGLERPKITYTNDQKDFYISIEVNGHSIKKKSTYHKQIELEFF